MGFIGSFVDLFAEFHFADSRLARPRCSAYVKCTQQRSGRTQTADPNERRLTGREARVAILRVLGCYSSDRRLPRMTNSMPVLRRWPAPQQMNQIPGMKVISVGDPVWGRVDTRKCLCEGPILIPQIDVALRVRLERIVEPWTSIPSPPRARIADMSGEPTMKLSRSMGFSRTSGFWLVPLGKTAQPS